MAKKTPAKRTTSKKAAVRKKAAAKQASTKKASSKKASSTRASAKKAAKKAVRKKAARKTVPKAAPARKKAGRRRRAGPPSAPQPVTTGEGAGPAEVGQGLVAMVRAGAPEPEIWDRWFHADFISIEGNGQAWHGRAAVEAKARQFYDENTVVSLAVEGPMVGGTGFAVRYAIVMVNNATGQQMHMAEVGVYTVRNGKVVQEEFMYGV